MLALVAMAAFLAWLTWGCTAVKDAELTGLRAEIAAIKNVVHDNSTRNYDEWTLRADALGRLIRDGLLYLGLALPGAYIGGKVIWLLAAKGLEALNGFRAKPKQPP
ncbi:MAG: hypothetical protein E3J64_02350 [Anaerolineales bacterium]|nr:MAG: hypothetical protein E3J64_02350 [Anaerolineales bacterium]